MLDELHVALHDLGKRQITPAPELRRRGAGDARDGRRTALMLDGDIRKFRFGKGCVARGAIARTAEQTAGAVRVGLLGLVELLIWLILWGRTPWLL